MDYKKLFDSLNPGFFEKAWIKSMPENYVFSELVMDLREEAWFALTDSRPEDYTEKWLETVRCPVIRIDGTLPVEENIRYLCDVIKR